MKKKLIPKAAKRESDSKRACPVCTKFQVCVIDTRTENKGLTIMRRLICALCGHRWTTHERISGSDSKQQAALLLLQKAIYKLTAAFVAEDVEIPTRCLPAEPVEIERAAG